MGLADKARRGKIPAVFDREATQTAGMQRRSNAVGLLPRAARETEARAEHLTDLRRALNEVLTASGGTPRSWEMNPNTVRGTTVRAQDFTDVRQSVAAVQ